MSGYPVIYGVPGLVTVEFENEEQEREALGDQRQWYAEQSRRQPAKRRSRKTGTGFVYFIAASGTGNVKIGFSADDPNKRLRSLQTGCPNELELLYSEPGAVADEKAYHALFAHLRVRGEWFRDDTELRAFLDSKIEEMP